MMRLDTIFFPIPAAVPYISAMLHIEIEQETDGRWLAEVPAIAGVLAYGETPAEARAHVEALALRVLAERIEHGEPLPSEAEPLFAAA